MLICSIQSNPRQGQHRYEIKSMKQNIVYIALVVKDYDEAIDFYVNTLQFDLLEDSAQPEQGKRWDLLQLHPEYPMAQR